MKPVERIMLFLYIMQKYGTTKEENAIFYRAYRVYSRRHFKYNTIPHTLSGEHTEAIFNF